MRGNLFHFLFPLIVSIAILCVSVPLHSQVLLNELLADPATDWNGDGVVNFRDDEWVEIINTGSETVSLDGLLITDGERDGTVRFAFSGSISAGGVLVVYGSEAKAWEEANGLPVYGLSLNNAGDTVSLLKVSGSDTILVDSISFGDKSAEDDRAVGRKQNEREIWALFDAYNPCTSNCEFVATGCIPTPGSVNECVTATEEKSWGAIKSIYGD
ncbi:MAG: hypothetical protein B6D63_02895 [Candidatus Latescibacteria bacterium 4484_7]|nr:MAG: hypothetical protein B6D63_02895 [Candidatus Latescibacteria bacterium 4484_7]